MNISNIRYAEYIGTNLDTPHYIVRFEESNIKINKTKQIVKEKYSYQSLIKQFNNVYEDEIRTDMITKRDVDELYKEVMAVNSHLGNDLKGQFIRNLGIENKDKVKYKLADVTFFNGTEYQIYIVGNSTLVDCEYNCLDENLATLERYINNNKMNQLVEVVIPFILVNDLSGNNPFEQKPKSCFESVIETLEALEALEELEKEIK